MKKSTVLAISLVIILGLLAAGCTQPAAPGPVTPGPVVTFPPAPTQDCLAPGATQQVPAYESVSITVDRNTVSESPTITTNFNGGQGLGMVQTMTVTVIHPDCTKD